MFGSKSTPFGRRLEPHESKISEPRSSQAERGHATEDLQASSGQASPNVFIARQPRWKLSDLVIPDETRRNIQRLKASVRNYEQLSEWSPLVFDPNRKYLAVNFYGPPGTGKTMCVEALAAEFDRPLLEVNYTEIESELWGKSSKNIQLAFRRAKEQNAVLFFDEADSVLGARINSPGHSSDQHINLSRSVLLKQLDSFSGIVMFATNLAKNYDSAFVRRIYAHIEMPLPDQFGRSVLWKRMLSPSLPGYAEIDWDSLAVASDGLAGGDIANAIRQALPDVHDRSGAERRVYLTDLTSAVESVRRSKQEVGK